ncbi:hypothetical protein [Allomesorhizobium alhagi]|uniref:Type I secretion system ATPase n=1 Tax=Mesorhizobium alhagi CCNWXJ12-2 TaxID=1107882 RepID=H0HYN3_9HYPH|nr:hypothetical protein [Mesorhizobium alhagi]EHK54153.1 hypothetical protein MAXJ12_26443 [Mesorhizobium alhagi CCNWXJ12-2]
MDKITEAIAHFIGLFQITLEEARLRDAYEEFKAQQARKQDEGDLSGLQVTAGAPFAFEGFSPEVKYAPVPPEYVWLDAASFVKFVPPDIPVLPPLQEAAFPGYVTPADANPGPSSGGRAVDLPDIPIIGSVAAIITQHIGLSDNDYFGVGGHGLLFSPEQNDGSEVTALLAEATELSPLADLELADLAGGARGFATTVVEQLAAAPQDSGGEAEVFRLQSTVIEGTYVNGRLVEEAPKLEDYLDLQDKAGEEADSEENDGTVHGSARQGETAEQETATNHYGSDTFKASVELQAGGNTLINAVNLENNWLAGSVSAVMGDHIELNVVIQINAWGDSDWITSSIASWANDPHDTTAFNIATFERYDPSASEGDSAEPIQGGFPKHWVVKEVTGDLLIMNWIEQYSFMMDNDIGILSSSGVTTRVIGGQNTGTNEISLAELGLNYDLIIIGGSVFDLNIIQQMNVLIDNDLIGALPDFQTTGNGSVSTGANLLWNQAHIYTVGGADRFEALPDAYGQAAKNLANGGNSLPDGVLNDSAFAGLGLLRVLHITGDLINLQYVKQTNILGDSDQVALAMNAVQPHPEADWTVSTGTNSLVNLAGITDVDGIGKTYVGGEQYSDEILIQAELISSEPDLGAQDPDKLVNEAVAFLSDDMTEADQTSPNGSGPYPTDAGQSDGLQSMLA